MQFFADHMELFQKEGRVTAEGNVVFISGGNRIYAERMEFNTKTRTGTFYNATGTAMLREAAQPNIFGTQEPDAFFWGEELQKIGPKNYRIIHGGFTTCVQPTPRWDLQSGSITLNLDDYAFLKNAVFRVKGVPLMYPADLLLSDPGRRPRHRLPDADLRLDDRARTVVSNEFFWAINRSQDATFEHDWFSKTGQQVGGEYRYVLGPARRDARSSRCSNEHATTDDEPDGATSDVYRDTQLHGRRRPDAAAAAHFRRAPTPTTSPASSRSSGISRTSIRRPTAAGGSAAT